MFTDLSNKKPLLKEIYVIYQINIIRHMISKSPFGSGILNISMTIVSRQGSRYLGSSEVGHGDNGA